MNIYLKSIGIAIVGVLLCLILSKNAKDYGIVIVLLLCCALCGAALGFMEPILELIGDLAHIIDNSSSWIKILMKTVGLSLIGEIASLICVDAGHAAVGKALQLLTTVAILWVSLPLIQHLMDLIGSILEML